MIKYFHQKSKFFVFRNTRFEQYLQNIDHSLDFVNEALTTGKAFTGLRCLIFLVRKDSRVPIPIAVTAIIFFSIGSKTAILTSNRVMTKRLDHLLHQNAIWSKAINPFQLTFTPYDPRNIRSTITSLGVLVQNGKKKINNNNIKSIFSQGKFLIKKCRFFMISI
jgi:hypothetical protein